MFNSNSCLIDPDLLDFISIYLQIIYQSVITLTPSNINTLTLIINSIQVIWWRDHEHPWLIYVCRERWLACLVRFYRKANAAQLLEKMSIMATKDPPEHYSRPLMGPARQRAQGHQPGSQTPQIPVGWSTKSNPWRPHLAPHSIQSHYDY